MKRLLPILALALAAGCSSPAATPNIDATVQAAVQATMAVLLPTPLPKAGPTPVPGTTAAYVGYMRPKLALIQEKFALVADLSDKADKDPMLLMDKGWEAQVRDALALIRDNAQGIQLYHYVPSELQTLHSRVTRVATEAIFLSETISAVYFNGEHPSGLTLATARWREAQPIMKDAIEQLDTLAAQK